MIRKIALAVLLAAVTTGCEKEQPEPQAPVTPEATPAAEEMKGAFDRAKEQGASAAEQAKESAAGVSEQATDQAGKLIDQATTYIKENKLDLAEKALNQAETYKASLPEALQTKLADARKMLQDAKAKQLPAQPEGQMP